MPKPAGNRQEISWGLAAAALAGGYAASMIYFSRGAWIFPLDDVYISLSYARNWLLGAPFRFNILDGPSTGATSILYTWLLVPLCAVLKPDAALVSGILAVNAALLWVSCRIVWGLARPCMSPFLARMCVFAILLNGPVTWGYFCGLDTGLMTTLTLFYWSAWLKTVENSQEGRLIPFTAASILLALCRPEGAFIVLAGGLSAFALLRKNSPRRGAELAAVGGGAFLLSILPAVILTGALMPSSGWAKASFCSPIMPLVGVAQSIFKYAVDSLKGIWMGVYPAEAAVGIMGHGAAHNEVVFYFLPGALIVFLIGALPWEPCRLFSLSGLSLWLAFWGLISVVLPVGWHHHRYLLPIFPVYIILCFAGISRIGEGSPERWRKSIPAALAAAWLGFSAMGILRFMAAFGHGSEAYKSHHRVMAEILKAEPEAGSAAAVDVGILKYYSGRSIVDLKGLTSPWLGGAAARGTGSLFDALKRMDRDKRPTFAALHNTRPDSDIGPLERSGVIIPKKTIVDAQGRIEFILYEFRWPDYDWAPNLKGWDLCDELDACDADSEAAHSYRIWMQSREGIPYSTVQARKDAAAGRVLGDGGWVLNGGETFRVRGTKGAPLLLFMRTFVPRASGIRVSLNGVEKEPIPLAADREGFQTVLILRDRGEYVGETNLIRIECAWPQAQEYSSFHYWAMEPTEAKRLPR